MKYDINSEKWWKASTLQKAIVPIFSDILFVDWKLLQMINWITRVSLKALTHNKQLFAHSLRVINSSVEYNTIQAFADPKTCFHYSKFES